MSGCTGRKLAQLVVQKSGTHQMLSLRTQHLDQKFRVGSLQTLAPALSAPGGDERLAKHSGFSLHAGVAAAAHQREKLERLCRSIARPAVATGRLSLTAQGQVRYTLKTPYRDGTTHVIFEPLDLVARLVALVPKPRVQLTRYHGVFAPHKALRSAVTSAGRGKGQQSCTRVHRARRLWCFHRA